MTYIYGCIIICVIVQLLRYGIVSVCFQSSYTYCERFICCAPITQHIQSLLSVHSLYFTSALHILVNMVPSGCMHLSAMHLSAVLLYMCNTSWLYLCILHFAHCVCTSWQSVALLCMQISELTEPVITCSTVKDVSNIRIEVGTNGEMHVHYVRTSI